MDLVEPHPLDYEWRYTPQTIEDLVRLANGAVRCLCIGVPSVARRFEAEGRNVILVDRQPMQGVAHHLRVDPSYEGPPAGKFDFVYVDPPWYPEVLRRWLGWAAAVADRRATIVCSLWPVSTRPSATDEHEDLFHWLAGWTDVQVTRAALGYESPPFEMAAESPATRPLGQRRGDRLELRPFAAVDLPPALPATERWLRLVFGNYQLGLRESPSHGAPPLIRPHPLAHGWIWPSVSRRAHGRDAIDLWSSHNEVAIVDEAGDLGRLLLTLRDGKAMRSLLKQNLALQPLLQWHLATLDFQRTARWMHLA
jgi:hypothetical protein